VAPFLRFPVKPKSGDAPGYEEVQLLHELWRTSLFTPFPRLLAGSGRCEVPLRAAFALMLLLSGEIAAHRPRGPSPTKARRRGGGRSAAGPPVYLTGAYWGTQDRSTLPEDSPPPRVRPERAPPRFRNLHHVAIDTT
jgi:hypothetical protein